MDVTLDEEIQIRLSDCGLELNVSSLANNGLKRGFFADIDVLESQIAM
jgi:hypothetical protein